ncbi:MAG: error-prone DNA polymerase, partial [Spongiibacteraceae bacterium]
VLLAPSHDAYSELCRIISKARLTSNKGSYTLSLKDLVQRCQHCFIIWLADPERSCATQQAEQLTNLFGNRLWLGLALHFPQQASRHYLSLYNLASQHRIPMVACGSVKMHSRHRKPLHDVLTATRHKTSVMKLGTQSQRNSEAYLKPLTTLAKHYPARLLEESHRIAKRCHFSLDELRYQYPDEVVPPGQNASDFLRSLTEAGARKRWPQGIPDTVPPLLEKELTLIAELKYEHYFLTVYDIVQFARARGILCQGRGSAANSAVCYCLQITEVDPSRGQLLFERFISKERDEPPDIDVDFEHERREEVIQYIYKKYGREHAALAATVITYRRRSAVRDVGKALNIDPMLLQKLAKNMAWWDQHEEFIARLKESGISADNPIIQLFLTLTRDIIGFPRHLSQHVGGFVIARAAITTLVPIENAAMPNRSIIQWDKEDLEALGLMKIDILALGMLSAIRKSLSYISRTRDTPMELADIPAEDSACYDMLCKADSIGVFQIESRAQMTMLPRLQPRCFYDLVIQIAIVRPGPIQGGMVHPFLRRRQGLEKISYANDAIAGVLERTLGVPIFQEQVIQVSMTAAGFSGGEADQLRRAMASWGHNGDLEFFKEKLINGMLERGYDLDFAERLFSQMKGFGAYGFPESHSASFALLAYASAWIKCHYPAEFYCGLLNSQPMGFYSPSQLTQDAKRHDVVIRPICINHSHWDHQLEYDIEPPALRLGFRLIKGMGKDASQQLCRSRDNNLYHDMSNFIARTLLNKQSLQCLVQADAFHCFDSHRYQSLWQASGYEVATPLFNTSQDLNEGITIPPPT